jgi:hypothetical protein
LQDKFINFSFASGISFQEKLVKKMKKFISAVAVIAIVSAFTSCKTKEKCPAYGKANPDNTKKEVRI